MPYKIVQTFEKGRPVLTAVPQEWEVNGILYWPKKHEIETQRKIENSVPDTIKWKKMKCSLKRSNLLTLTEAEYEVDKMSHLSDTETDTENYRSRSYKQNENMNLQQSYNELARQCCVESQPVKEKVTTQVSDSHNLQDMIVITTTQASQSVITNSDIFTSTPSFELITENHAGMKHKNLMSHVLMSENCTPLAAPFSQNTKTSNAIGASEHLAMIMQKLEQVQEEVKTLTGDIKTISENQQTLYENQNSLLLKFTEHQTQFEEFVKLSCKPKESAPKISDFEAIGTENELQNLELLLKDPDFKSRLISKIEVVCSKGKNRGINNAYALIDILFQRNFLIKCSWAGGSRTDDTKIALKSYTNILNLLFSVCHESDPDFKKPDCERFLKTVLKNSRQRCNSKQLRMSTVRHRQKVKKTTDTTSKRSGKVDEKENKLNEPPISKNMSLECTAGPSTASFNENTTDEEEERSLC